MNPQGHGRRGLCRRLGRDPPAAASTEPDQPPVRGRPDHALGTSSTRIRGRSRGPVTRWTASSRTSGGVAPSQGRSIRAP